MWKPTKRKAVKVGSKTIQRLDHMKQPKKKMRCGGGGGGGGGIIRGGLAYLPMGNVNFGETEECISEILFYSWEWHLYLNVRTVALFYAWILLIISICSKLKTSWKSVVFTNKVGKNSRYFVGVFEKTIIPLTLVGYEMIITNSPLCISLAIYHLISNTHLWNRPCSTCTIDSASVLLGF